MRFWSTPLFPGAVALLGAALVVATLPERTDCNAPFDGAAWRAAVRAADYEAARPLGIRLVDCGTLDGAAGASPVCREVA